MNANSIIQVTQTSTKVLVPSAEFFTDQLAEGAQAVVDAQSQRDGAAAYALIADQASITSSNWAGVASTHAAAAANDRSLADAAAAAIVAELAGVTLTNATLNAATKDLLAALSTTLGLPAQLAHRLAGGMHAWVVPTAPEIAAFQADVAADTGRMLYIPPASSTGLATDGSQGYWRRSGFAGFLRPEWADDFVGTGGASDQPAFDHLNSLTAHLGYAHVWLTPGTTYMVNRQSLNTGGFYQQGVNGIDATGLSSVIILGNGATLKTNPGLKFGCFNPGTGAVVNYTTASPAPNSAKADIGYAINVDTCALVSIRDVILDGNAASHTIGGTTTTGDTETKHYGLRDVNNAQAAVENVKSSNFLTDNCVAHDIVLTEADTPRPHSYRNCTFDTAGRNSFSWTGGIGYTFDNCVFRGGASVIVAGGGFLKSAPGSAFDVEAETGIIRKGRWTNCTFDQGANGVTCVTAGNGDSKDLVFDQCKLIGQIFAHQPRMIFDKCRVYGYFGATYGSTDPNLATQINNCWVTDATSGSTPQLAPSGNLVMGAAGTGTTISRTTFDLSFTLGNPQGCNTYNCTYILRHNTTTLASGSTVMTLGAGIYNENLTIIDSIASNAPASPYNISIGVTTIRNGNLVSAAPNIKWVASGSTGFTGRYDNSSRTGIGVVGYGTGSGGTATQVTSKSTGVTLSKASGQITMRNSALAAGAVVSFLLTNTLIAADDELVVRIKSGNATAGTYRVWAEGNAAGSRTINVQNISAGSLSEALVLGFMLLKGSSI